MQRIQKDIRGLVQRKEATVETLKNQRKEETVEDQNESNEKSKNGKTLEQ